VSRDDFEEGLAGILIGSACVAAAGLAILALAILVEYWPW